MIDLSTFLDHDYDARVIADSVAPHGGRLTSILVTFPRFILAEMATHRRESLLSMNSASSRAIPIAKRIQMVKEHPVIPIHFGKAQPGMAAHEALEEAAGVQAATLWLAAAGNAVNAAEEALKIGGHKQWVNRLLEPFLWHTVLLTGTEWTNFFHLRIDRAAQPEMIRTAVLIARAYFGSTPRALNVREWHLPFLTEEEARRQRVGLDEEVACLELSAARCARLSYNNFAGGCDPVKDRELWGRLAQAGHLSPAEHQGRAMAEYARYVPSGNFIGFDQHRQDLLDQEIQTLLFLEEYLARLEGWEEVLA